MSLRFLGAAEIQAALPLPVAIHALERAFAATDPSGGPLRGRLETPRGQLLLMPAWSEAGVGVKLVTVTPGNVEIGAPFVAAVYVLFDEATQQPVAVLDGGALTAIRTAAVSALATKHLAREDAHRLVIVGAGVQGRAHLASIGAVRSIDDVAVISRTQASAEQLVEGARTEGVPARIGVPEDLAGADVICTCTTSSVPVVRGDALSPGVHINAVGAFTPQMRELDTAAVARARVVVETRASALEEAGDLLIPMAEGAFGRDQVVADLHEVVNGAAVRRGADDVTVFKSVGLAFEDLVTASAATAQA
jgi:ornithine cyclodeaminase/alanine dehydrogenase-like protein (mu-crystallin family)